MKTNEERFLRLAERVADGEPVDWERETGEGDEDSARLRSLRMLERIRAIHQGEDAAADVAATRTLRPEERPAPEGNGWREGAMWGGLRLVEAVGHGAYGEVWRAWDESLQTDVALKLLIPGRRPTDEVLREARQMAKVRHENVVTVHGAAIRDGRIGIWSSYVRGKTLEAELRERGPLAAAEAAVVATDLLRGLAAVHAAGLLHRDVKTTNVMREEGGRIVLMDFGTVVERDGLDSLALDDAFAGTARYMAPEIFRGSRGGPSSDLYSVGVVLYRLVSGSYPVDARDLAGIRRKHEQGESVPLRDVRPDAPAVFVRIVERALAPAPEERYASAGEMERDLQAFLAGSTTARESPPRPAPWPRFAFGLAAAVVAIGIWIAIDRGRSGGGALDVEAALFRSRVGVEERLTAGGRVQPGDQLFLELRPSEDLWAYVINEDEEGNAYLLFPLADMEPANPLAAGETHRLPGRRDGVEIDWDVDSYGGSETLYVVASREPLADLEAEVAKLPQAGSAAAIVLPFESLRRGIGGLAPTPGADARSDAPPLAGMFESLSGEASGAKGLWTWSIRLENPAP